MSYCRWSCDDFKSDVYVYEAEQGFTTHVASNRVVSALPAVPILPDAEPYDDWIAAHREYAAALSAAKREPIGLPLDGKTFVDGDLESLLGRLLALRALGYHVPDHAIERIYEEMANEATQ